MEGIIQPSYFQSNMKIFVKSSDCISAQLTFNESIPVDIINNDGPFLNCQKPEYKKYINPKQLRRMSPIIRNGVTCSLSALQKANIDQPDGIIIGTSLGCLKDTQSFLTQLIEDNEQLPNPTSFIQSTHNTIAGQLALLLKCKNYNFTFSQLQQSFECALLDAELLIKEDKASDVLVGGVDELNEDLYGVIKDLNCYKNTIMGEGAGFFVLSKESGDILYNGVHIINGRNPKWDEELDSLSLKKGDIDLIIGGDNTPNDTLYADIKEYFSDSAYARYKPFVGEFGTASAIGMWLGVKAIEDQGVSESWLLKSENISQLRNVLIYNRNEDEHSYILLAKQ